MSIVSFASLGKAGRLGNQLWQIAATMAYAKKHNKYPVFPQWEYQRFFKNNIPTGKWSVDRVYNEPTFEYHEIPYFDTDVNLEGYFQSIKYHEGIDVQELFQLGYSDQGLLEDILIPKSNPNKLKTVSLHIRRGDYLKPPHDTYHGVLPMSYYNLAIERLVGTKWDETMFVVFSDDIEYCKKAIDLPNVYFSEGENEVHDLFLMASCDDNIIANSSFSYWAALLNKNPNKRVVMPKNWFGPSANLNTKDLYLPNSIVL